VLAVLVSIAAASLSYYFVERPFLRLKGRINRVSHGRVVLSEA
jgi:peptidoglycan/LPS O-acetylase OafA/YrhL